MNPMLNLFPINVHCKHPLLNSIKMKYAICVLHQNRQHMWIVGSLWFGVYLLQVAIFCLGIYKIATSFSGHQYVTSILQHVSNLNSVMVLYFGHGQYFSSTSVTNIQHKFSRGLVSSGSTGCIIRFWHKVKTWLDQMFWQIYQKLMLSGFLSSGNLCLIHYLKLFWPHAASTASVRKGAI